MENDTGTQHIMYSTKSNRCRTSGSKKDDKDGHDYEFTADVLYGPTSVCGVVKHRSGWVEPIKDALERQRFRVNLRRTSDYETVVFALEGSVVYACAAKNLSFRGCAHRDPTAEAAVRTLVAERARAVEQLLRSRAAVVVVPGAASAAGSDATRPTRSSHAPPSSPVRGITAGASAPLARSVRVMNT